MTTCQLDVLFQRSVSCHATSTYAPMRPAPIRTMGVAISFRGVGASSLRWVGCMRSCCDERMSKGRVAEIIVGQAMNGEVWRREVSEGCC